MERAGTEKPLSNAAFVVLALLAEGESHGYHLERQAHARGFRYWTDLKRSSIYLALKRLLALGLVQSRLEEGGGPARKVYAITSAGQERLEADALTHLAAPGHPRSELDLGLYALPFVPRLHAQAALAQGRVVLEGRARFLQERLAWCRENQLPLVALSFERPLLALQAELGWLERVQRALEAGELVAEPEWGRYEYRETT